MRLFFTDDMPANCSECELHHRHKCLIKSVVDNFEARIRGIPDYKCPLGYVDLGWYSRRAAEAARYEQIYGGLEDESISED